jgi:Kef-type K+ transport system membrane component KefB
VFCWLYASLRRYLTLWLYIQILLALCVALVNAANGITAFYVVLATMGFGLFMFFAIRPAFIWILRRTHSLQDGPTQGVMVLTILLVSLISARMYLTKERDFRYPFLFIYNL